MAKTRIPCIAMVLLAGAAIFLGCSYENSSVLSFIRSVTKIAIPEHITTIAEYDQGELEAGGKYRLARTEIEAFVAKNNFQALDRRHGWLSHFNGMAEAGLVPMSDTIPLSDTTHLKYLYGCRPGNAWLFTINEKSGECWIEVQYPDWQGEGPACGP